MAGSIADGVVLLVGIEPGDTFHDVDRAADKVANLRIFSDENGLMNRSITETGGSALVVSQFTLMGDVRKGRRPSFVGAADPEQAEPMLERLTELLREAGIRTETGVFGATMEVDLVNDGPVTIILEIREGRVI